MDLFVVKSVLVSVCVMEELVFCLYLSVIPWIIKIKCDFYRPVDEPFIFVMYF